jgi:hypothetical protein
MEPGTIVKPTVQYAQFMTRHGCRAPYDGVVLEVEGPYARVVWNNTEPHARWTWTKDLEEQPMQMGVAMLAALTEEANELGGES